MLMLFLGKYLFIKLSHIKGKLKTIIEQKDKKNAKERLL